MTTTRAASKNPNALQLSTHPIGETGTVMRADTLKQYARDASFRDAEILPVENFFFRPYRLRQ